MSSAVSCVRLPMDEGMEPLRLLAARNAVVIDDSKPISVGSVPRRPRLPLRLSWTTLPLPSHATFDQPPHGSEIVFQLARVALFSGYLEGGKEGGRSAR